MKKIFQFFLTAFTAVFLFMAPFSQYNAEAHIHNSFNLSVTAAFLNPSFDNLFPLNTNVWEVHFFNFNSTNMPWIKIQSSYFKENQIKNNTKLKAGQEEVFRPESMQRYWTSKKEFYMSHARIYFDEPEIIELENYFDSNIKNSQNVSDNDLKPYQISKNDKWKLVNSMINCSDKAYKNKNETIISRDLKKLQKFFRKCFPSFKITNFNQNNRQFDLWPTLAKKINCLMEFLGYPDNYYTSVDYIIDKKYTKTINNIIELISVPELNLNKKGQWYKISNVLIENIKNKQIIFLDTHRLRNFLQDVQMNLNRYNSDLRLFEDKAIKAGRKILDKTSDYTRDTISRTKLFWEKQRNGTLRSKEEFDLYCQSEQRNTKKQILKRLEKTYKKSMNQEPPPNLP